MKMAGKMGDVEAARGDVLEACRMLDIYTVNMLEYAHWYFRASQPANVRAARRRHAAAPGRGKRR